MSTILSIIIVCVILGIIAIYIFNYSHVRKQNIRDLYTEGLDLLIAGRRKEAYRNFKSIIDKDTNSIGAYIKLGQVVREGGNPKKALEIHKNLLLRNKLSNYDKIELYKFDIHSNQTIRDMIERDRVTDDISNFLLKSSFKISLNKSLKASLTKSLFYF